jgi:hypothetical protein
MKIFQVQRLRILSTKLFCGKLSLLSASVGFSFILLYDPENYAMFLQNVRQALSTTFGVITQKVWNIIPSVVSSVMLSVYHVIQH